MIFSQAKDILVLQKGVCLLFAVIVGCSSISELLQPASVPVITDVSPGLAHYSSFAVELVISLAALALFWWLHRRVRSVIASELGLHIMSKPARAVMWSEVRAVRKVLPNLMSGYLLVSLADGTDFYTPIERAPPSLSTLGQWFGWPTEFEQLSRKHGVWIE